MNNNLKKKFTNLNKDFFLFLFGVRDDFGRKSRNQRQNQRKDFFLSSSQILDKFSSRISKNLENQNSGKR